jgi:hypothetical protein
VTRVCPKHTWSNNLAVLECLQDVREVRRRAGPGAGPRVSPAWEPPMPVCCLPRFPCAALAPPRLRSSGLHPHPTPTPPPPRPLSLSHCCGGVWDEDLGAGPQFAEALSVFLFAPVFCVMLCAEWLLMENQFRIFPQFHLDNL